MTGALRFGNYIGDAGDSEEEGSQIDDTGADAYVDLDDEELEQQHDEQLMDIDGGFSGRCGGSRG